MPDYEIVRKLFSVMANHSDLRQATAIVSHKHTLKITRQRPARKNARAETYILTVGAPNYVERIYIKDCIAAGEPFPVKRPLLRFWPKSGK